MAHRRVLRVTVGSPSNHAGVWRIWVNPKKSDVYVAARSVADQFKISLHESGTWRQGFTADHVSKPNRVLIEVPDHRRDEVAATLRGQDRVVVRWQRPDHSVMGAIAAFSIVVPYSELRAPRHPLSERDIRKIVFVRPVDQREAMQLSIIIGMSDEPAEGWPTHSRRGDPIQLLGKLPLPNHQAVWIFAHEIDLSQKAREEVKLMKQYRIEGQDRHAVDLRGFVAMKTAKEHRWYLDVAVTEDDV